MNTSSIAPLFGRLLLLQGNVQQAVNARQWGWLEELDKQLRLLLQELEPYRHGLNERQRAALAQFGRQYRQAWQQVSDEAARLDEQLQALRRRREGSLAYDWVSQAGGEE
ncbi:hypothetical protein [Zobellella iuensis]|uniref:Flagellar protein FliT n=1 Tax=Zobellella iuensis TaxID=2803811 RepID=A0ABS1QXG9_9GAMM|nr:hypothetical protein [Zobellella iuensis]MBL1378843.1 hypothetical protein [Zobellella iuensis]